MNQVELVSQYFPEAPRRCLQCPGLFAAAQLLETGYMIASTSAEMHLNPESDEQAHAARFTGLISDTVMQNDQQVQAVARDLYENCTGAIVDTEESTVTVEGKQPSRFGAARQRTVELTMSRETSTCASALPAAHFIGSQVNETIVGLSIG